MAKRQIDVNALIDHYIRDIGILTQRAIVAETRAEQAEAELDKETTDEH